MKRFWPVLFLFVLPVIPLWRCVFLGEAMGPFDQVRQMAPWHGPKPAQPWDVLQADGVLQFYPWRDMVFKAWGHGQLPLWNNYELAGTPLLANSQSAGFYPPHVLLGVLHAPTPLAMLILAWFHLFWAGLGAYLLARRFGASKTGAAIAGASFELSAFMLAWTALPSVITTVAWIPWLLFGIKGIFEFGQTGRGVLRSTLVTSLSVGMMLLAGHLQFAAYGLMAGAILALCLLIEGWLESNRNVAGGASADQMQRDLDDDTFASTPPLRDDQRADSPGRVKSPWIESSIRTILAFAFGFALAAPQLLPVLNYGQYSHRKNSPTQEGYAAYTAGAIKPFELANLTYPYTLGSPRTPVSLGEHTVSAYWPALEKPGANLAEAALTVGPFTAGLLVLLPWKRKRLWPLALIGLLAILLALGTALNWPLYFLVPGWSSTGSPGRIIVLFVLASSVLAGHAVAEAPGPGSSEPLAARNATTQRTQGFVALLCPVSVTALCLLVAQMEASDKTARMASDAATAALTPALLGALIGTAGVALLVFPAVAKFRPVLVAIPVFLAWLGYAGDIIPTGQPIPVKEPTDFERVAYVNDPWSLLVAAPALAPPNTAYLLGRHELGGYDSLLHRDTKALLDSVDGQDSSPPANGNMVFVKPNADPGKLVESGVSEVDSLRPLSDFGEPLDEGGIDHYRLHPHAFEYSSPARGLVLALTQVGRAVSEGGRAGIVSESCSQVVVQAAGPGRLVLRDRNMPGWLAKVDGKHVSILGTTWREVDLPPGEHMVEFNYVPPGLMNGLFIGIPAWLLLVALALASCHEGRQAPLVSQK